MNASNTTAAEDSQPGFSLRKVGLVLKDPVRWRILRELAKGEPLPVIELARRVRRTQDCVSKNMLMLKEAGLAVQGYGRLYRLSPACQPAPGSMDVDLGVCVLKLGALP